MTTIRTKKRENPFVQIDKSVFTNDKLSWKAKGILGYLLSRPDDWVTYLADLEKRSTDGRDSVRNGLKELEEQGYLEKTRKREGGKFKGWEYTVFEIPQDVKTEVGLTEVGKPEIGKTEVGKPDTTNKEVTNKDLTNNELTNKDKYITCAEFVKMKESEYQKLIEEHGQVLTDKMITVLDNYKGSSGKKYKSDYRAILSWVKDKVLNEGGGRVAKNRNAQQLAEDHGLPF
ncbi:helix-turn-helix domain-containing protein [Bacillus badius]|uniref:Phage replication initiation protein n=1 Tax=Bacillus badius TaxID=1455 RepID=A0ABR5AYV6_BACBA|nr:helix-turn-helix domain-containing protein [Bacillus badius]KIL79546.1 Phage replication initiation protein [Bacillus badius]MED4718631.1 helix-turn-helix domain-containing protein [Bacillus badius]